MSIFHFCMCNFQIFSLIVSLMYLVNTRLDICFVMNTLSQVMVEPRQEHWVVAKHVLRYLRGIVEYGLSYLGDGEGKMQGYSNSNWAGNATDRKTTLGCCFSLGSMMLSWFSRKQNFVAPSSTEVEYMATRTASCEAIWLCKLLVGLFDQELEPIVVYLDNQSVSNSLRI
jgi:hypothetical protein